MVNGFNSHFQDAISSYFENLISALPKIIIGLVLFLIILFIGVLIKRLSNSYLRKKLEDKLLVNFVSRTILTIFIIFGLIIFLNRVGLGAAAGGLLAGAGVSALIIGLAFKDIGENFLAGFFLAFSRPFGMGDVIESGGTLGTVKALNLRNTHIRTYDGKDIFIPNAMLIKNQLINYTRDGLMRHNFIVGIDYSTDMVSVFKKITDMLYSIPMIEKRDELKPFVLINDFGPNTVNIQIYYWTDNENFEGSTILLKSEIMRQVLQMLVNDGFALPANIMELKNYDPIKPIRIQIEGQSFQIPDSKKE
jgi:small-conductance mechanosensitive channel